MKIIHIIGKMKKAGVESVVFNYLENIDDKELVFDVLYDSDSTVDPPKTLLEKGVGFIKIPPYTKLFAYMKAIVKILKTGEYDAVHVHMNSLSVFALLASKIAGVKHRICHNHSTTSKRETKRNILKLILRPFCPLFATEYAACGEKAGRWMYGDRRFEKGDVTVFNNAIDIKRFAFSSEERMSERKKLGLENNFVIGHVGRFVTQKNHEFLLDIFADFSKVRTDARLLLVGDGDLFSKMKEKASALGIPDKVIFVGKTDDTAPYYCAMDVFCLPSLYEGLPVAALEAEASGAYCLLSDAVTKECKVTDNVSFLPIDKGVGVWTDALLNIKEVDREKSRAVFKNSKFNIENSAGDLVSFYKDRLKK